jgi:hypothetical protein
MIGTFFSERGGGGLFFFEAASQTPKNLTQHAFYRMPTQQLAVTISPV